MDSVTKTHNQRVIRQSKPHDAPDAEPKSKCNCRQKDQCLLRGRCLETAVVYKATVRYDNKENAYYGLAGGTFKDRYRNHVKSTKHGKYKNKAQLSKCIWNLKKKYTVTWGIIKKVKPKCKKKRLVQPLLGGKIQNHLQQRRPQQKIRTNLKVQTREQTSQKTTGASK